MTKQRERIGRAWIMALALVLTCVFVLAACGGRSSQPTSTEVEQESAAASEAQQEVTVPDLSGMYCLRAVEQLEGLGLEAAVRSDNGKMVIDQTNWKVIDQDPAAGETLKQGQSVIVMVSKEKSEEADQTQVNVPDLVGSKCSKAEKKLKKIGLTPVIESDDGKTVVKKSNWTVIAQDPGEGASVPKGAEIRLVVSKEGGEEKSETSSETSTKAPSEQEDATVGQLNALRKAESYLAFTAFSYTGLIEQLKFEGFTDEEAAYGADNCGADWNEQAAKKAQDYQNMMGFSHQGLVEQLEFEGFTPEEAEYGASAIGL